jgi:hypothetical protein
VLAPVAPLLRRTESRETRERSGTGLVPQRPGTTCTPLAAAGAGTATARLPPLVPAADGKPEARADPRVRPLVAPSPPEGILGLDAPRFAPQGPPSVGGQRQDGEARGQRATGPVVGRAPDGAAARPRTAPLALPQRGAHDPQRRTRASLPEELPCQTTPESAHSLRDGATPPGPQGRGEAPEPGWLCGGASGGVRRPEEVRPAAAPTPEKPNRRCTGRCSPGCFTLSSSG